MSIVVTSVWNSACVFICFSSVSGIRETGSKRANRESAVSNHSIIVLIAECNCSASASAIRSFCSLSAIFSCTYNTKYSTSVNVLFLPQSFYTSQKIHNIRKFLLRCLTSFFFITLLRVISSFTYSTINTISAIFFFLYLRQRKSFPISQKICKHFIARTWNLDRKSWRIGRKINNFHNCICLSISRQIYQFQN